MTNNLEETVNKYMDCYFDAVDNAHYLDEYNRNLIKRVELGIANIPENSELKHLINKKLDEYYDKNKHLGNTESMNIADELKLTRTKKENLPAKSGFVNIAILLYGIINIGVIVAIALMK